MIALDSSVLARYVLNDNPDEAVVASQFIVNNSCSVSWSVLVELCWVLEYRAGLPRSEVVGSLAAIGDSDCIAVPNRASMAWAIERYAKGADFADMVHLVSAMNGATEFACFDRKLARQAGEDSPIAVRTLRA